MGYALGPRPSAQPDLTRSPMVSTTRLAIFDLDDTLLDGDTDSLWVSFLVEAGCLGRDVADVHDAHHHDYCSGRLDVDAYYGFMLETFAAAPRHELRALRERFVEQRLRPRLRPAVADRVRSHLRRGEHTMLATATCDWLVEPIVEEAGFHSLIATRVTGERGLPDAALRSLPRIGQRKLDAVVEAAALAGADLRSATAYSDSINDVPLLEAVGVALMVTPCPALSEHGRTRGWQELDLGTAA